jgi:hypothetical protein
MYPARRMDRDPHCPCTRHADGCTRILNAAVSGPVLVRAVDKTLESRAIAVLGPVFGLLGMPTPCACWSVGPYVRPIEEENELSAWLALERATLLLHGLFAHRAQRCHWVRGTPETINNFNCAQHLSHQRVPFRGLKSDGVCCGVSKPGVNSTLLLG